MPSDIPPEGLLAKAVYPWKARQETDLTFDKDDIILVKEQDDMKWFGELNGKVCIQHVVVKTMHPKYQISTTTCNEFVEKPISVLDIS